MRNIWIYFYLVAWITHPSQGMWSNWSVCSANCGSGIQSRSAENGVHETKPCSTQPCNIESPVDLNRYDETENILPDESLGTKEDNDMQNEEQSIHESLWTKDQNNDMPHNRIHFSHATEKIPAKGPAYEEQSSHESLKRNHDDISFHEKSIRYSKPHESELRFSLSEEELDFQQMDQHSMDDHVSGMYSSVASSVVHTNHQLEKEYENSKGMSEVIIICIRHMPYTPRDIFEHVLNIWSIESQSLSTLYKGLLWYTKIVHIATLMVFTAGVGFWTYRLATSAAWNTVTQSKRNIKDNNKPSIDQISKHRKVLKVSLSQPTLVHQMKALAGEQDSYLASVEKSVNKNVRENLSSEELLKDFYNNV